MFKKPIYLDNFDNKNSFYHDKQYHLDNEHCIISIHVVRSELLNYTTTDLMSLT